MHDVFVSNFVLLFALLYGEFLPWSICCTLWSTLVRLGMGAVHESGNPMHELDEADRQKVLLPPLKS